MAFFNFVFSRIVAMCQSTTAQSVPGKLSTETLDVTVQRTEFTGASKDELQFAGKADSKVV